ncbi:hypothetical protein DEO72_LG5g1654 [Vigna unguiculata]|uniref:Uncharacterized protein n=1 Tax=Vigna unguiculata TaxID=3917 RepID=A0A4D6LX17_VIGUN|nr:hypothetical protein DEO72_LG5g1654 [Vigna unguiculata]
MTVHAPLMSVNAVSPPEPVPDLRDQPSRCTSRSTSKRATCEPVRAFVGEEERCTVSQ